jgi:hypothetical protein
MKKYFVLSLFALFAIISPLSAQTDTLHLNYHYTQTSAHDSTQARIDEWIKSLNGKHVDIQIVAYFHKPEFKKAADARSEELFLILNRKARALFTFVSNGSKKGKDYQRTMVDIIYKPTVTPEELAAAAAKAKAEAEAAAKAKEEAKAAKKAEEEEKKKKEGAAKKVETEKPKGSKAAEGKSGDTSKKTAAEKNKNSKSEKEELSEDEKEEAIASKSSKYPAKRMQMKIGVNEEQLALIKSAKIIVCGTHSNHNDRLLLNAVKQFWTFNTNYAVMPYDSASALAKKDKTVLLLFITRIVTKDMSKKNKTVGVGSLAMNYTTQDVAWSDAVVLEKGRQKVLFTSFFPRMNEEPKIRQEMVNFAVSVMNSTFSNMEAQGLKKARRMNSPFEKNASALANRTLLIPKEFLSKKILPNDVAAHYHGKFEVVDYQIYADAILNRKPFAYVVPVPFSIAGDIRYYDYIVDAESGQVYYIANVHLFRAPEISDPLGGRHNLVHHERIGAKNLEKYNKAFETKKDKEDEPEEEIKDEPEAGEAEGESEEKKEKSNAPKKAKETSTKEKAKK